MPVDMNTETKSQITVSWLTLFASTGTLICCAVPIVLVTVGLGATVAAMTSNFPIIMSLSQQKAWVFGVSALLLVTSGWLLYRSFRSCPADPAEARSCKRVHNMNRRVLRLSAAIWSVGFFAAYLALPLRTALGI